MKKIIIVTNSISGGGAENSMLLIHKHLTSRGLNTTLFALNSDSPNLSSQIGIIEFGRQWKSGIFATIAMLRSFRAKIKVESPNVVILNCELPELCGAFTQFRNCKIVSVEHTTRPWFQRRFLGRIVRWILKKRGSIWVTVNSGDPSIWPNGQLATYIPNPINLTISDRDHVTINSLAFIGRLRPEKHVDWAIELSNSLNLPLDIYGEGVELEALSEMSESLGVDVKFHGYEGNVWGKVRDGQLVIIPSEFEGDGIVVLEALAMDCPVILADNKDLRRFQLPDLNYASSVTEMAEKIRGNPADQFYVPKTIRSHLLRNRSIEHVTREWIKIFNS